jgi:hypothetical protein
LDNQITQAMTKKFAELTTPEREEIIRFILDSPIELSSNNIGAEVGMNRETIRRIRVGILWPEILPQKPRVTSEQMKLRCNQCLHYVEVQKREIVDGVDFRHKGRCTLGIPEASEIIFARGCGAFTAATVTQ